MNYNTIIADIVKALVPVIVAGISVLGTKLVSVITANKKLAFLKTIATQAVQLAEEEGVSLNLSAPEKLQSAVDFVVHYSGSHHVTVTPEQATSLVLAALTEFRQVEASLLPSLMPYLEAQAQHEAGQQETPATLPTEAPTNVTGDSPAEGAPAAVGDQGSGEAAPDALPV